MSPQELAPWLERIEGAQRHVQSETGAIKLGLYRAAASLLSAPRRLKNDAPQIWPALQKPWFPFWPALSSKPLHDPADFAWTKILKQAHRDIVEELVQVTDRFGRAAYDSKVHNKPWNTYYFNLRSHAFSEHLNQCPRTAEALAQLPTNRFHVCYSAIQPGGHLAPHTGPTNTSLTAHLGLANCDGARLFVADTAAEYRDGEVLVFDDSYVHWVEHTGSEIRYTLMVTVWHPELNPAERFFLEQAAKLIRT